MNSNAFCPISTHRIDERVARANAALTVLLLLIFIITQNIVPVIILWADFLIRGLQFSKYSPFSRTSKFLLNKLKLEKNLVNDGPKVFAARIGILFSTAIIISLLLNLQLLAFVLAFVFGACAFLEFAFGFCIACKIYPFVYKVLYHTQVNKLEV